VRLALVGAFPFPAPQGSQRYAAGQARALAAAGCRVTLFCYGRGDGRAAADLSLVRAPAWLSQRRLGAGPHPAKPATDAALAAALLRAHRRHPFDACLAHNAEAALLALAVRAVGGPPVVYVAHTLWREELETYAPAALAPLARAVGAGLDALLARRADAVLALSRAGAEVLGARARGPLAHLPPGLAQRPAPAAAEVARAARRAGVTPGAYAVYAGNLDRYQDLPLLDAAAARAPGLPCLVATHAAHDPALAHLRRVVVTGPQEARALVFGARLAVLPRRRAGGFPMKLLDYLEAARPVVAYARVADTLVHGESGWLLQPGAGAEAMAGAMQSLAADEALAARLAAGAQHVLAARHAWPPLAAATLELARAAAGG
jgi:1,2-diacylglycerol 3-alpha-glucosyltransferase